MRVIELASKNYKKVCDEFPNLAILTTSATPGKFQLTFAHVSVGNKSLRESVVAFALAGSLDPTYVFSIEVDIAFATDAKITPLPITEVLLRAAASDLTRSKISGTGRRATPSSSCHSSLRLQSSTGGWTRGIS